MSSRPSRLADVLRAVIQRLPVASELTHFELWTHWEAIVGATIARHAEPRRLRRGLLLVAVDSPEWMQELQFLKLDLRERLNARLGRAAIRDIFMVLEIP